MRLGLVIAALIATSASASAETPEERAATLVTEGEALGKLGRFDEALARFHEAERVAPNPIHDCYIAVGFARQGKFAHARFYLERCKARANKPEPVSWYATALATVLEGSADYGRVEVQVSLEGVGSATATSIAIRNYPDLPLESGAVVWLPPGSYVIDFARDGFVSTSKTVELSSRGSRVARATLVAERVERTKKRPTLAYINIGVATAALAGAIAMHVRASGIRDRAGETRDPDQFASDLDSFRMNRNIALSLYAVSAVAAGAATYLLLRGDESSDSARVAV